MGGGERKDQKYQKYTFFWQAFSSKTGLILPFEKKIISMFLFQEHIIEVIFPLREGTSCTSLQMDKKNEHLSYPE
jgi:hypothetical protein